MSKIVIKERRNMMTISYNKLWKLMIDKNINKTKLREEAGISSNAMAKLGKNVRSIRSPCKDLQNT